MHVFTGGPRRVGSLALSSDGRWLAAAAEPDTAVPQVVRVWDRQGADAPVWEAARDTLIYGLSFEPGGRHLLVNLLEPVLRVAVGSWTAADDPFLTGFGPAAFSADGRAAVAGRWDRREKRLAVRVARRAGRGWAEQWRTRAGEELRVDGGDYHLLLAPAGQRVVLIDRRDWFGGATAEYLIRSFDGKTGRDKGEWVGELPAYLHRPAVGPGGVLALFRERSLYAVNLADPDAQSVKRVNPSRKHFTDLTFSPDGRWLLTAGKDGSVTPWDAAMWEPAGPLGLGIGPLRAVTFSPGGSLCAAAGDGGKVVVWDFDG